MKYVGNQRQLSRVHIHLHGSTAVTTAVSRTRVGLIQFHCGSGTMDQGIPNTMSDPQNALSYKTTTQI